MAMILAAAGAVFAGIFHVDGQAAQVFEQYLPGHTGVTAGARSRDQNLALRRGPARQLAGYLRLQLLVRQIKRHRALKRLRLLVDLA
jgi:hypothetical protein